jgi:uncharacterized protein (DUF433 family)
MRKSETAHIYLADDGRAWIDDTNTKVIEVVLDQIGYKLSPEQMHEDHPHLSLAQIHAALAYYYDHKAEFDAEIERQYRRYQEMRADPTGQAAREELLERLKRRQARGQLR